MNTGGPIDSGISNMSEQVMLRLSGMLLVSLYFFQAGAVSGLALKV